MWSIASLDFESRFVAAPLAGISNPVYRMLCMRHGAAYTVSEMISDKALHYHNAKTFGMCRVFEEEHPVALQLFGSDPVTMGEAARYLEKSTSCDMIDINMGCPVPKVIKAHAGSFLMQDPAHAFDIVKAVKENTRKPVTVKMRIGWDKEHVNCVEVALRCQEAGASAVAVHGRTRGQMYSGEVDYASIKAVKDALRIPVIGNGDVKTPEDAERMFRNTGVDAIMIGRGLLGRPYFLDQLRDPGMQEPSYEEKISLVRDYAKKLCEYEGEKGGAMMMRGMAGWFIAGMPCASRYKNRLAQASSLAMMLDILEEYRVFLLEKQ